MEVSALKYGPPGVRWRSPVAWRQSDERVVASVRRGNHAAFTVLVKRYEARLLAFCRQMLRSREDAEDVLQEVFVAAFNAMLADDRPINVQPWLYRIARNRSLNHLRRIKAISVDPMEMPEAEIGASTADTVHRREELRLLVGDIQKLPETQRSALVLREMEALSYDEIAEVMDKSVPSVKSLLVRARVSLAAAREGRAGKSVASLLPLAPIAVLRRFVLSHLGHSTGAATGATAAGAGGAMLAGSSTGGLVVAGIGAMATKTAAGLAAAALVTAGAVAIESGTGQPRHRRTASVAVGHGGATGPVQAIAAAPGVPPVPPAAAPVRRYVSPPVTHRPIVVRPASDVHVPTAAPVATPAPDKTHPAKISQRDRVKVKKVRKARASPVTITTDTSRAATSTTATSTTSAATTSSATTTTTTDTTTTTSTATSTTVTSTSSATTDTSTETSSTPADSGLAADG
jgi:RNA polymerase sigma factor (sigma-70 family)